MSSQPVWLTEYQRTPTLDQMLGGSWAKRQWMNTPGPFYTGEADFCLLGPGWAPDVVALDADMADIVFRQPVTQSELAQFEEAACSDPFGGYMDDGNEHWTIEAVQDWWGRSPEIREHINQHLFDRSWWHHESELPLIRKIGESWLRFLDSEAEPYLRDYCFFLDNGSWPTSDANRPEL